MAKVSFTLALRKEYDVFHQSWVPRGGPFMTL